MAQIIESFGVEGEYKPLHFTSTSSDPLAHGQLYKLQNTVGVIFVAERINTTTGCRETLEVRNGEIGVLVYSCEDIRVPKAGVAILVGDAIYWDGVHGNPVTNVWASGLLRIGIAKEDRDAAHDDIAIDLHGDLVDDEIAP